MQILIDNKPAAIKKDSSFELNLQSYLFTDTENFSLNIDFPLDIQENRAIFGTIVDLDGLESNTFVCYINDGDFELSGYIQVLSVQDSILSAQFIEDFSQNIGEGISSIYLDELTLGNVISLIGLSNVNWADNLSVPKQQIIFPNTWTINPTTVFNLADYGLQCLRFTSNEEKYNYLLVPRGEDITQTPVFQLYLWKLFDLLSNVLDYRFSYPPVDCFSKILICNATDQGYKYEGFLREDLDLSKILPHWTIYEFLNKLGNMFGCYVDINHRKKHVSFVKIDGHSISSITLDRFDIVDNISIETIDNSPKYRNLVGFQFPRNNDEDKYNSCQDLTDFVVERGQIYNWQNISDLLLHVKNAAETGVGPISGNLVQHIVLSDEDFIKISEYILEKEEESPTSFDDNSIFHQDNDYDRNYTLYIVSQSIVSQLEVGSMLWYVGVNSQIIPDGHTGYGYLLRNCSLFNVYKIEGSTAYLSFIEIFIPGYEQRTYMDFRLLNQLAVHGFETLQDLDIMPVKLTKFESFPFEEDRLEKEPLPFDLDSMVNYPNAFLLGEDTTELSDLVKEYKKVKYQHDRLYIAIFDNDNQDYRDRLIPSVCHREIVNKVVHVPNEESDVYDYDRYEYLSGIATRQYYLDIDSWQQLNLPKIDTSRKYTIHVITNDTISPNHIYVINGAKYICKNIKINITTNGISEDKELELYRIID